MTKREQKNSKVLLTHKWFEHFVHIDQMHFEPSLRLSLGGPISFLRRSRREMSFVGMSM